MMNLNSSEERGAPTFLRQREMNELVDAEQNPVTRDLMVFAYHSLVSLVIRKAEGPIADFDLRYFMQVIQEFSSDHDGLRGFLDGKSNDTEWIAEDSLFTPEA
jgi:hypothetical protein